MELDIGVHPLVDQGPVITKAVAVMFTFWFIRDLEGCMAKLPDLTLNRQAKVVTCGSQRQRQTQGRWAASAKGVPLPDGGLSVLHGMRAHRGVEGYVR